MPLPNSQGNNSDFEPLKVDIDPVFRGGKKEDNETPIASAYNVLSNQQYVPTNTGSTQQAPTTRTIPKSSIRTYRDDIQAAIQANHLSSVNIAMAENEKIRDKIQSKEEKKGDVSSDNKKAKKVLTILSLIVLTALVVAGFVYFQNNKPVVQTQTQQLPTLMTSEYTDELNVDSIVKDRFLSALSSRLNDTQIPVNNVYRVYVTMGTSTNKKLARVGEFADLAGLNVPDVLKRNLTQEFMIGMYSFGQNLPFVILKTSYPDNSFSSMLEWEKDLERDFSLLFRLNNQNGGGIASALTPATANKFEDTVVMNQDVRVIKGTDGKIVFLYGILDKDTIVITTNEIAFKEILTRLNREKSLKR